MSMLRRGHGAVTNLRCKSGARFPPIHRLDVLGENIQTRAPAMAVA